MISVPHSPRSVVTIGAFDGLHLGHQRMIETVRARAQNLQLQPWVLSFDPLPREFFAREALLRLLTVSQKQQWLAAQGVALHSLSFDQALANLSPDQFVDEVLVPKLRPAEVWVGEDFCYGHRRAGNFTTLQAAGAQHDFTVHAFPQVDFAGERISATRVRQAIYAADFELAARLLGRRYQFEGAVIHGQKLARSLGFPTANLRWPAAIPEMYGVYAVRVNSVGPIALNHHHAVASLGVRPTVNGTQPWLELHLFDFSGDLYGQALSVDFVSKLRSEEKFASIELMVEQIGKDCQQARALLGRPRLALPEELL
jgi:riboflavin kinase / FMN adenylyltransferase